SVCHCFCFCSAAEMKAGFALVLTQLYCWHLNLVASAGSDVDSECYRRAVSCIQCSTESVHEPTGARLCRDPFDARIKTEFKQLHKSSASSLAAGGPIAAIVKYNISTVMCDGYCIKWVKVPLLGGDTHVVRTCSSSMDIRFSQNTPVCISESRTGRGTMCFCRENMCNSATHSRVTKTATYYILASCLLINRLLMNYLLLASNIVSIC
ncbi:hypothetical protein BOX15_Mlig019584g1, partial [Macrostomum lignano]